MHTINFKKPLVAIDGKTDQSITLANALAEIIGSETEGKTLKLYGWMKTLQLGQPLILDDSDKQDLRELIEKNKRIYINVKGQLLEAIDSGK